MNVHRNVLNVIAIMMSFIVFFIIYKKINENNGIPVRSDMNKKEYFVQDIPDKNSAANLLSIVDTKIIILKTYLKENINHYPKYAKYIKQLCDKSHNLVLQENNIDSKYTSYTINKGEEMVLCLRSKKNKKNLHDENLVTYVVIHELAHISCPEINHTELFKEIFKFLLETSIAIGIYKHEDYKTRPVEYCGMTINENITDTKDSS